MSLIVTTTPLLPPLVGGVPVTFDETDRLSEIESP